jgi:hypothetical protein
MWAGNGDVLAPEDVYSRAVTPTGLSVRPKCPRPTIISPQGGGILCCSPSWCSGHLGSAATPSMVSPTASYRQEGTCRRAMGRGFVYRMRDGMSSARSPVGDAISEKRAPAGFALEARENRSGDGRCSRTRARVKPLKQPHVPCSMCPMTARRRCPHTSPKDAQPLDDLPLYTRGFQDFPAIGVGHTCARLCALAG